MTDADDLDRASELMQVQTDAALADVRHAARPEQVVGPDGKWHQTDCEDCGEGIPVARLRLGKIRCIDCQRIVERRRAGL